jgi:hypothetical protein
MTAITAAQLGEFDYKFLIDASFSQGTKDCAGGKKSRWDFMQETLLSTFADIEKFDSDGVEVLIYQGSQVHEHKGVTSATLPGILAKYEPRNSTPTAEALRKVLPVTAGSNGKKLFIQCWTDGVPNSKEGVEDILIAQASAQKNDEDCTVQFVQVGFDEEAGDWLLNELDNGLKAKAKAMGRDIHDIVDVRTMKDLEAFANPVDMIVAGIND